MRSICRVALFAVLAAVAVLGLPSRAHSAANEVYFPKTKELAWNGGTALTKSFTAAATDTGFLTLPPDVAWQAYMTAGVNTVISVRFYCPTAAANADTVHYTTQMPFYAAATVAGVPTGAATYPYTDFRDFTPAVTCAATHVSPGLVFQGAIQLSTSASPTSLLPGVYPIGTRIKVQGDPNGALANLRCQITYLSTTP